ncbi:MAG: sugar phosphate isomerase/epimerase [Opitutaceae bacterium]|nr:sugar phosphate isomerase/epimerase [Opitutaceae bacterium]
MKIGIDTFSFHIALAAGRYDVFRTLDWLAQQGFSGVQLNINGPQGRFLGGDPDDAAHVRRVRTHLETLGFFAEIGGGHATDAALVARQLELAAEVGADTLRTVIGFHGTIDQTIAEARAAMTEVLPLARRLGVRIAIENHEDVTAAELRQLLEAIDDPLIGACLDTGNDLVVYGDPVEAARALAPRTISTHIKDQKLVRVAGTIYSAGTALGAGDIDLPAILPVISSTAPVDRILIQNTTGYAAPLNKFQRPDLQPAENYANIPIYESAATLREAGLYLDLENLPPADLHALAARQEQDIRKDLNYLRALPER